MLCQKDGFRNSLLGNLEFGIWILQCDLWRKESISLVILNIQSPIYNHQSLGSLFMSQ